MGNSVPLIRASVLAPFERWMETHGLPFDRVLADVGLGPLAIAEPDRPVPLLSVAASFRAMSEIAGPDICCRVVGGRSLQDLAGIGNVLIGARTPREGLINAAAAISRHCSHEMLTVSAKPGGIVVHEMFLLPFDPLTLHLEHQHVAALFQALLQRTGARLPVFDRVEIAPHPELGVAHLHAWFGRDVIAAPGRSLVLCIDAAVADRPFLRASPGGGHIARRDDWTSLRADGSLAGSARIAVAAMFDEGQPSIERLAAAAGASRRTLQRRLSAEGVSFSDLVEDVRRDRALHAITAGASPIGAIAASLGYSKQSALTRAVRRWTGEAPRTLRDRRIK